MKLNSVQICVFTILAFVTTSKTTAADDDTARAQDLKGFVLQQADGTFLNLCVEKNNFVVYLFDSMKQEKQPVPFDHARMEYKPPNHNRKMAFLTRSDDGLSLRSVRLAKRPHTFPFWLHLFKWDSNEDETLITGRFVQPFEENETPEVESET